LLTRATLSLALYILLMVSGPLALHLVNSGRLSSRFYVWAVPVLMLLIGAFVAAIPRRLGAILGGMLVVVLLTFTVIEVQYKDRGDADWRVLMGTIAERQAEGDLLVSFSMHNGQIAASYYLPQQLPIVGGMLARVGDAIFFMEPGEAWSGYRSGYWAGSGTEPSLAGVEQENRFAADLTGAKRLWFVAESDMLEKYPIVKKVLDEGWVEKEHWDYPPFILNLYELRPDMGNQVSQ